MENTENFENNIPAQEPVQPEAPARKPSPFADSPYEAFTPGYTVPQKPKKQPGSRKGWRAALCALLAIVLVAGSCLGTAAVLDSKWEARLEQLKASFQKELDALEGELASAGTVYVPGTTVSSAEGLTPAQVYAMNVRSVVMVYNTVTGSQFGQSGISTGSGFFLTQDGYVVTNYHVVEGGGVLSITTWDNTEYPATLVGFDSTNDVALLKVEGESFPAAQLGSSDALVVGDQVVAIGNPLGELTATQTVGYVSAIGRDVNTSGFAINMIQTDAAINSGNSGGPLFNMNGQVVGITTAKYSGTSGSGATIEGIGFAIPIDDVKGLIEDLTTYGYVNTPYLGISVSDMDPEAAAYLNMPMGAYVQSVVDGYCAKKAGMQPKDVIVAVGEYEVTGVNSLSRALRKFSAGDTTTVTVIRGGQQLELSITLDQRPQEVSDPQTPQAPSDLPEGGSWEDYYNYFRDFFGIDE